jgi:UDP-N-acetylmuramoylalanine--D-glutamate ligase
MIIAILGLGKTGQSLAKYFAGQGQEVWGIDDSHPEKLTLKSPADFSKTFLAGDKPELASVDRFFISPGVGPKHSLAQQALKRGLPLEGELDLAQSLCRGKIMAITGTNGKSTTSSLLSEILRTEGLNTGVGGNLGTPFLDLVQDPQGFTHFVVEVSSYQLETAQKFHPHLAILLNLSEDHFSRHPSMAEYLAAKGKIFQNQGPEDDAIYNSDDLHVLEAIHGIRSNLVPFSNLKKVKGAYATAEAIYWAPEGKFESSFKLSECSLKGLHNLENMTAAVAAAKRLGISDASIAQILRTFKGLPHRMEKIAEFNGVSFYDDSKGTNVGALVMSLASFDEKVLLILGGVDKGGDYFPLRPLLKAKVDAALVMGEAKEKILHALEGATRLIPVAVMKEAVSKAMELAGPGSTVLLSPACSSFDQYRDYAHRGEDFQKCVNELRKMI